MYSNYCQSHRSPLCQWCCIEMADLSVSICRGEEEILGNKKHVPTAGLYNTVEAVVHVPGLKIVGLILTCINKSILH